MSLIPSAIPLLRRVVNAAATPRNITGQDRSDGQTASRAAAGMSTHKVLLFGALYGAWLLGVLAGGALGQQQPLAPAQSRGFKTDVLGTLDLAEEIQGMAGRQLRMRRITVEPGGQFAMHDHRDRPGLFYLQEGTITEYPDGDGAREHGAGQAVAVGFRTRHWEENRGTVPVVVIAVDIVKK